MIRAFSTFPYISSKNSKYKRSQSLCGYPVHVHVQGKLKALQNCKFFSPVVSKDSRRREGNEYLCRLPYIQLTAIDLYIYFHSAVSMASASTGLAFSGGGIRSAAFCSGVLRRLLERRATVDYLSCVSGGGYTGTAFLDWKYREERKARVEGKEGEGQHDWHGDFFENMKQKAGYLCDWNNPIQGIFDTIILSGIALLVTFIQPIIIWGSYACPVAFIIDFIFGKFLRRKSDCNVVAEASTRKSGSEAAGISGKTGSLMPDQRAALQAIREHCLLRQGTEASYLLILFAVLFIIFITSYTLVRIKNLNARFRYFLRMTQYTFFIFLALTFIPFAIHDFLFKIPLWAQLLVVPIFVVVWIVVPLLRKKTSYVLIIYLYSYFIYWKVYEDKLLGVAYSELLFNRLLFASGIVLWIVPIVASLHERIVHVYNR